MKRRVQAVAGIVTALGGIAIVITANHNRAVPHVKRRVRGAMIVANHNRALGL